ncbi:MAG TPA: lipoyl(octanoyl) transferase LipB [Ferruginibacter sp.]|nr:lipoyl(octanoyl) transferase LipB [Ferruginibacter sp.]
MDKQKVIFKDLGIIEYKSAWDYQESLLQQNVKIKSAIRKDEKGCDNHHNINDASNLHTTNYFLLCEHPAVYTLGKSGKKENVLMSDEDLAANDIAFFNTNRGGDITFHGLQQIVGYPILDLENYYTDIGRYLRSLEEVIILTIGEYGLKGERSKGETGVWLDTGSVGSERKICAIGVRCSRWITMHGFALNVNTNLDYFNNIIPCGIKDKQVTSLQKELGHLLDYDEVKEKIKKNFEIVFNSELIS